MRQRQLEFSVSLIGVLWGKGSLNSQVTSISFARPRRETTLTILKAQALSNMSDGHCRLVILRYMGTYIKPVRNSAHRQAFCAAGILSLRK